jgi:hypothetical protein
MKVLKSLTDTYCKVSLKVFNTYCTMYIHHLVFFHHYGIQVIPHGMHINHINKNVHDNSIKNLELISI